MSYRFKSADGLAQSNDRAAIALWDSIGADTATQQREASARLRATGVKAEHPDDGWVDRERNSVQFCYPRFNDGVDVGDLIALGWPWSGYRIVRCTRIEHSGILLPTVRYFFDPLADSGGSGAGR